MPTEIILLERVESLGQMGDVVKVKSGYARNFLLPKKKALRATKENVAYFETQKKVLEATNLKKRDEAATLAKKVDGLKVVIIRQAAEAGQLFGSVSSRDIAEAITAAGVKVDRNQVQVNQAFKLIGLFPVSVALHPEVKSTVTLNIARSEEEAATQEKTGKALIATSGREEAAAEAAAKAEAAKAKAAAKAAEAPAEEAPASEDEAAA
ncbi:MAG: 50S ribosomal protein L9 [Micavibrio aeruginosavorus]|uniref:Large ribosomal subunit protein bL9 n=1 Tax=Micavibrio aeruginosavorus TaxID=349221 RepID=A0A2W5FQ51_9BACT|nr:MAG: 50S ribosomal protein L9 [Micavibrio aeruginosavorus]